MSSPRNGVAGAEPAAIAARGGATALYFPPCVVLGSGARSRRHGRGRIVSHDRRPDPHAHAVRDLVTRSRTSTPAPATETPKHGDDAARLDPIEREGQEIRTRVNALFFAVIAAGIADLVARMAPR